MLLQGNIEKVNRRTLEHFSKLATDLTELGARYNAFSLSEQSPSVAAAIERIGQAADTTYIETEELNAILGATFAEPMRESAQFAGVVRSVLRYRVLKRVQQEMTKEELEKKKAFLDSLERSELESKRIDAYLSSSVAPQTSADRPSIDKTSNTSRQEVDDNASADSDFPPTHGDTPASPPMTHPHHQTPSSTSPGSSTPHRKSQSGNFVTNKILGGFRHAVNGFVDNDPEKTRRDQLSKTKESLVQLERALEVSESDVRDASSGVLKDIKRFQKEKEDDLQRYMVRVPPLVRFHTGWSFPPIVNVADSVYRSLTPGVILIGPRRTWIPGPKHERKWTKL